MVEEGGEDQCEGDAAELSGSRTSGAREPEVSGEVPSRPPSCSRSAGHSLPRRRGASSGG